MRYSSYSRIDEFYYECYVWCRFIVFVVLLAAVGATTTLTLSMSELSLDIGTVVAGPFFFGIGYALALVHFLSSSSSMLASEICNYSSSSEKS